MLEQKQLSRNSLIYPRWLVFPVVLLISMNQALAEPARISNEAVTKDSLLSAASVALCGKQNIPPRPVPGIDPNDQRIHVQADSADIGEENTTIFNGDVKIQQGTRSLEADRVIYNKDTEDLNAEGHIQLRQDSFEVTGDSADVQFSNDKAKIENATFQDYDTRARGKAKSISILSKTDAELKDAIYTTCDPNDPDWVLSADKIVLDNKSRQGYAYNVVVKFKGVPFLYLPYIRFPIGNERLSGFLYPSFATSEKHGGELYVPYYWNIHPQLDSVITPHHMDKRGTRLLTDTRYLTENHSGNIGFEYLSKDKLTGDDRESWLWKHGTREVDGWSFNIDYRSVGDTNYLNDFGNDLDSSSTTYLEQRADATYNAENWEFRGRFQEFQTLSGSEPVKLQPQLLVNTRQSSEVNTTNFDLSANWTRFVHKTQSPVGERAVLKPEVSFPFVHPAFEIKPRLLLHYTQYDLNRTNNTDNSKPARSVPVFSLDNTLFLEREMYVDNSNYTHTLEPRLKYIYIPYREQSQLPLFDTGELTTNYEQLFSEFRFSGEDRVGDYNVISLGLTSRILDPAGQELLTLNIGQSYYLKDRRVTLDGTTAETRDKSDIFAGIQFRPTSAWTIYGNWQYDTLQDHTSSRDVHLQYRTDSNHIFNLGYRNKRDELETREISSIWKIHPRWKLIGMNHYDIKQSRDLENIFGIQYESCCWGLRLVKRKYYNKPGQDDAHEDTIFLELELKGLSSFGQNQDIETTLGKSIPGYTQE